MQIDRSMKAALALVALGLVRLMKPARRCCECAYQRGYESGYQHGRAVRSGPGGGGRGP